MTPSGAGYWASLVGQDANVIVPSAFAQLMGGLDGGAVLADLVWWQSTHGDWFWRTDALISDRQHVTLYAVKRARDLLTRKGLLAQRMAGQPAKAHYRLDLDAVLSAVARSPKSSPSDFDRSRPQEPDRSSPPQSNGASPDQSGRSFQLKGEVTGIPNPAATPASSVSTASAVVVGKAMVITPVDLDAGPPQPERVRKWDPFFTHVGQTLALDPWQKRRPTEPASWARDLSKLFAPLCEANPTAACALFDQFIAWSKKTRYGSATRMTYIRSNTVREHAAAWVREVQRAEPAGDTFDVYGLSPAYLANLAAQPGHGDLPF